MSINKITVPDISGLKLMQFYSLTAFVIKPFNF